MDDQQGDQQQQPRYWFPYWTNPPLLPPQPPIRPQAPSRWESRPSTPSPSVAPSPSRRSPHDACPPMSTSKGTSQPSKPSPSSSPLLPIKEPTHHPRPPRPTQEVPKPQVDPHRTKPTEVDTSEKKPKHKDIPQEKTIREPDPIPSKTKELKVKEKAKEKSKEVVLHHVDEKPKEVVDEAKEGHGEHGKLQKEIKAGFSDMMQKMNAMHAHNSPSGHERAASIITLAGQNKGASMKIGREGAGKEQQGQKFDGKKAAEGGKGMHALINSNVQVINNSLLLQSSCSGGDPGVHLKLSTKSKKEKKQGDGEDGRGGGSRAAASVAYGGSTAGKK